MPTESDDSPEVERKDLNQSSFRSYSISTNPQVRQLILSPSVNINDPLGHPMNTPGMNYPPLRSPAHPIHQTEIISPTPRLPSSLSTLLNQAESEAHQEGATRRRRDSTHRSPNRRLSASPGPYPPSTDQTHHRSSRSRSPFRPTMTAQRHSFHAPSTRPPHPPRDTFRTYPLNRSRPSSPGSSAEERLRRRPEISLPHLAETSIGQALPFVRRSSQQATSDNRPSNYAPGGGYGQYRHDMRRSVTYPDHHSPRVTLYPGVHTALTGHDHHQPRHAVAHRRGSLPRAEAWVTLAEPRNRDMSSWTPQEAARYQEGYRDAMQAVADGEVMLGEDQRLPIRIHDPRTTEYQQMTTSIYPTQAPHVPPPQPPQLVHRRPMRSDNPRIDPPLQSPGTHRRLSYSSSNLATPTGTTIIHPPPTSEYFGTSFHHRSPSTNYPPVKRAKRQQISCFPCRERKLKCDGKTPCAQCSKRHIDGQCKYAERIRRRGRGKKVEEGQGLEESEEHEYDVEEGDQAESSAMAQRRNERAMGVEGGNVDRPRGDQGEDHPVDGGVGMARRRSAGTAQPRSDHSGGMRFDEDTGHFK